MAFTPQVNITFDAGILKNLASTTYNFVHQNGYCYIKDMDNDGYPQSLTSNILSQSALPSDITTSTVLVLAWKGTIGDGGVGLSCDNTPAFNVLTGSQFVVGGTTYGLRGTGTNGYIEFQFATANTGFNLGFEAANNTNFSGLYFGKKSEYASWLAATSPGDLFSDSYVNVLKGLNVKTLRMLGANNPNERNLFTQHRYRNKWQTAQKFGPGSSFFKGAITASPNGLIAGTNNYTCLKAPDCGSTLTRGDMLHGYIVNPANGAMTLDDGRGAKPILFANGYPIGVMYSDIYTFIYDELFDAWVAGFSGVGCTSLMPIEMCVGLCNRVNANLWFNIQPHLNYADIIPMVTHVRDNLAPGLSATFEYGNEIWNFGGGFEATDFALRAGAIWGIPDGDNRRHHAYYGVQVMRYYPLIKSAWAPRDPSQLHLTIGMQGAGNTQPGGDYDVYRFRGKDLDTTLGYAGYNSYVGQSYNAYPNRPRDLCDRMSPGSYIAGGQTFAYDIQWVVGNTAGVTAAADQFAAGGAANIAAAMAWMDADVRNGMSTSGVQTYECLNSQIAIRIPRWEATAASFDGDGSPRLTIDIYEGALESWWPSTSECNTLGISTSYGGPTGKIANMIDAYKNGPLFYNFCLDYYRAFSSSPHAGQPSWFQIGGGNCWSMSKYNKSDALGSLYQSADATRAVGNGMRRMIVKR